MAANNSTFATTLRRLRESAGLSMRELAELAGLTRQAIHKFEKPAPGTSPTPSWAAVQKLAAALGVSTDEFQDDP